MNSSVLGNQHSNRIYFDLILNFDGSKLLEFQQYPNTAEEHNFEQRSVNLQNLTLNHDLRLAASSCAAAVYEYDFLGCRPTYIDTSTAPPRDVRRPCGDVGSGGRGGTILECHL